MKPPPDASVMGSPGLGSQKASAPCSANAGRWVLTATILASSMAFIDGTVVNVALPALQTSFAATVVDAQWVVESYGLTLGALILVGGSMGDLKGRRLMFLIGVVTFAIASTLCGISSTIRMLILWRGVQGVGAAFLIPGSLSIISACFDRAERGRAIGTWSGATAITTALGPVLGGWLIEHLSWRWAFFINLPLAVAVIAISLWRVPESRSLQVRRIDWVGALAITLSLAGIVFGFIESSALGWRHPLVTTSLFVGLLFLAVFVVVEARGSSPMVPLNLFQSRAFTGANLLTLFLYAAIGIFFFLLPLNLIQIQGYSATEAGAAVLPVILLLFSLSRWSGGLVARYGAKMPLIVGPLTAALGFLLFAVPSVGGSYWLTFFLPIVVLGLGMAVSIAPLTTVVMESIADDRAGTASGINNAVARVASLLAIAVFGIIMATEFSAHLNEALMTIAMPESARYALQSNEIKLGALTPPAGLGSTTAAAIHAAIAASFVSGFRLIMGICAGLAMGSAAVTWRMIPANRTPAMTASSQSADFVSSRSPARAD